jgi:hypothetical protein
MSRSHPFGRPSRTAVRANAALVENSSSNAVGTGADLKNRDGGDDAEGNLLLCLRMLIANYAHMLRGGHTCVDCAILSICRNQDGIRRCVHSGKLELDSGANDVFNKT